MLWAPESLNWRQWFLEVHVPALETWVFPELEEKLRKKVVAPSRHETLVSLLDEVAERMALSVALSLVGDGGIHRVSYREWRERAILVGQELVRLGVGTGDRVALAAHNHPDWAIAFMGIQYAGATAVPLDAAIDVGACDVVLKASRARVLLCDAKVGGRLRSSLTADVLFADLAGSTGGPEAASGAEPKTARLPTPEDVAALIYTSGTTESPKGVMLSHYNLTSLVASLMPLFPLEPDDRLLSVLPLHHTFS